MWHLCVIKYDSRPWPDCYFSCEVVIMNAQFSVTWHVYTAWSSLKLRFVSRFDCRTKFGRTRNSLSNFLGTTTHLNMPHFETLDQQLLKQETRHCHQSNVRNRWTSPRRGDLKLEKTRIDSKEREKTQKKCFIIDLPRKRKYRHFTNIAAAAVQFQIHHLLRLKLSRKNRSDEQMDSSSIIDWTLLPIINLDYSSLPPLTNVYTFDFKRTRLPNILAIPFTSCCSSFSPIRSIFLPFKYRALCYCISSANRQTDGRTDGLYPILDVTFIYWHRQHN